MAVDFRGSQLTQMPCFNTFTGWSDISISRNYRHTFMTYTWTWKGETSGNMTRHSRGAFTCLSGVCWPRVPLLRYDWFNAVTVNCRAAGPTTRKKGVKYIFLRCSIRMSCCLVFTHSRILIFLNKGGLIFN